MITAIGCSPSHLRPTASGNSPLTSSTTLGDILRKKYFVPEIYKSDIKVGSLVDINKDFMTVMSPEYCFGENRLKGAYAGKADLPELQRLTESKFDLSLETSSLLVPGLNAKSELSKGLSARIEKISYAGFAFGEATLTSQCQVSLYTRYMDHLIDGRFTNPKLIVQVIYADSVLLEINESSRKLLTSKAVISRLLEIDAHALVEEINDEKLRIKNRRVIALSIGDLLSSRTPGRNLPKKELGRDIYEIVPVSAISIPGAKRSISIDPVLSVPN